MEVKKKMRLPARATVFYGAGIVLSKLVGVITTPIFTRAMTGEEYGLYSYYISILSITTMISGVFLTPAVFYSGLDKFPHNKRGFINKSILLVSLVNFCFCIILFTFKSFFRIENEFIAIILFQGVIDAIINSELLFSKFSYGYKRVLAISLSSSILSAILSILFVTTMKMGALGRALGLLLSSTAVAIALILSKNNRGKKGVGERNFLIRNATPLIPAVIARASIGWADKLIIRDRLGVSSLAKYSVAHTIGTALFALLGALSSALNPWLVRKLGSKNKGEVFPVIREISALASWGGVAVIALAPEIFAFLAPSEYRDAIYVIAPLALSSAPYFLFTAASVFIGFTEKTKAITTASIIGATVNIIANLLLISHLGYLGGAIAYLVAEAVMLSVAIILVKRWDKDVARALSPSFEVYLSLLVGVAFTMLYSNSPIRIFLLIIPACEVARHGFYCLQIAKEK